MPRPPSPIIPIGCDGPENDFRSPPTALQNSIPALPQVATSTTGITCQKDETALIDVSTPNSIRKSVEPFRNLYVSHLPPHYNSNALRETFSAFGTVVSAKVLHDEKTNQSRGVGFVFYESSEDGKKALATMMSNPPPGLQDIVVRKAHNKALPAALREGETSTQSNPAPTTASSASPLVQQVPAPSPMTPPTMNFVPQYAPSVFVTPMYMQPNVTSYMYPAPPTTYYVMQPQMYTYAAPAQPMSMAFSLEPPI